MPFWAFEVKCVGGEPGGVGRGRRRERLVGLVVGDPDVGSPRYERPDAWSIISCYLITS
jgi:hypothetical protein